VRRKEEDISKIIASARKRNKNLKTTSSDKSAAKMGKEKTDSTIKTKDKMQRKMQTPLCLLIFNI